MIKDSGERTQFYSEDGRELAVRDMHQGKGRMDLLFWNAIMELSHHCEEGAFKYKEHNCEKGIPLHSLFDSGMRHAIKWYLGYRDENHLRAACWNFMLALEQETTHPELDDLYYHQLNDIGFDTSDLMTLDGDEE